MCFFFKQKTAYEMRISDWSSDVCSSDLRCLIGEGGRDPVEADREMAEPERPADAGGAPAARASRDQRHPARERHQRQWPEVERREQIGRASCRERVCQYV